MYGHPRSVHMQPQPSTHFLSFAGVLVRVIFQCEFSVGFFDFLRWGLGADTQEVVVAGFVNHVDNLTAG